MNALRLKKNEWLFAGDIFKYIFVNENVCILIKISQNFVPEDPVVISRNWFRLIAWCLLGAMPLPEPILTNLNKTYGVSRPQIQGHCDLISSTHDPGISRSQPYRQRTAFSSGPTLTCIIFLLYFTPDSDQPGCSFQFNHVFVDRISWNVFAFFVARCRTWKRWVKSLAPSDAIWPQRSGSPLA